MGLAWLIGPIENDGSSKASQQLVTRVNKMFYGKRGRLGEPIRHDELHLHAKPSFLF